MTIDERLVRLTERHEALTMSMELMSHQHSADTAALKGIAEKTLESIKRLENIARAHETRIAALEPEEGP